METSIRQNSYHYTLRHAIARNMVKTVSAIVISLALFSGVGLPYINSLLHTRSALAQLTEEPTVRCYVCENGVCTLVDLPAGQCPGGEGSVLEPPPLFEPPLPPATLPPALPPRCGEAGGDVNRDQRLDIVDLKILLAAMGSAAYDARADLNCDMVIDILDYTAWLAYWLNANPSLSV